MLKDELESDWTLDRKLITKIYFYSDDIHKRKNLFNRMQNMLEKQGILKKLSEVTIYDIDEDDCKVGYKIIEKWSCLFCDTLVICDMISGMKEKREILELLNEIHIIKMETLIMLLNRINENIKMDVINE